MARKKKIKNKEKKNYLNQAVIIVVIIIVIIIALVTLGLFPWPSKKERLLKRKDEITKRLLEIDTRIGILEKTKQENVRQEKKVFFIARLVIGSMLIAANYVYIIYNNEKPILEIILELNGIIILGYSFIAFLFYGTIEALVNAVKAKYLRALKIGKFMSQSELDSLIKEKEKLETTLSELETELEQNKLSYENIS